MSNEPKTLVTVTAGSWQDCNVSIDEKKLRGLVNLTLKIGVGQDPVINLELLPEFIDIVCEAGIDAINGIEPEALDNLIKLVKRLSEEKGKSVNDIVADIEALYE